jgi:hypothetical protein
MDSPRVYHPRSVFVPIEQRVQGYDGTPLRTSDGCVYVRDATTQVIRRVLARVKGKSARRADKRARRTAPARSTATGGIDS